MSVERRHLPTDRARVHIEKRDDGSRTITGYAAVFYREGDAGTEFKIFSDLVERIMPTAFDDMLTEKQDVRGLFNHDSNNLLARVSSGTLTLSVDETGLRYDIPVDENDPDHLRVVAKIERGDLNGSSFSFIPRPSGIVYAETEDADIRELHKLNVYDVGPVTFPAYESTTAGMRAVSDIEDVKTERDRWKAEQLRRPHAKRARARLAELEI
jgi:uncharacterized protein